MRIIYMTTLLAMNGAVMLTIPTAVVESLSLAPEMLVSLSIADERLIVETRRRRSYRLGELLLRCDISADMSEDDRVWLDTAPLWPEDA